MFFFSSVASLRFFCMRSQGGRSEKSSGRSDAAGSGHLGNSARRMQSSVAAKDGVRFTAPPHSIEFS